MNTLLMAGTAIAGIGVLQWRFRKPVATYGSAGFMTLWQAVRRRVFFSYPKGLIVGDWKPGMYLPVFYRGNSNILTVAPPGSGKGTSMLIPNALRWPFQFLLDLGGEISAVSIKAWRAKGYRIYCYNPWGMHTQAPYHLPSHSVNPLDFVDPKSDEFASTARRMAAGCITRTGNESDSFFLDKAEAGLAALIMHVKSAYPPDMQNLLTVRRCITGDAKQWETLIRDMQQNPAEEAIRNQGNEWARMSGVKDNREFSSHQSTMERATAFIDDGIVRSSITESDINFRDLKSGKGTIISVVVPLEYAQTHSALIRLMLECALLTMQSGKPAVSKVLFTLDEFAVLGHVKAILNGLATMRRYRVIFHIVVQNVGQLKGTYKEGWNQIEGSCELRQFIAAWDLETSEHVSKHCGTTSVENRTMNGRGQPSTNFVSRPLLTPEEVQQLPNTQQVVFMGNSRPMLLRARPYWERPSLQGLFHDNPYHGVTKAPPVTWPLQAIVGAVTYAVGCALGPSRTFLAVVAAGVAWTADIGIRVDAAATGQGMTCTYQGVWRSEVWQPLGRCGLLEIHGRVFL